jgi:hypothetical protein
VGSWGFVRGLEKVMDLLSYIGQRVNKKSMAAVMAATPLFI